MKRWEKTKDAGSLWLEYNWGWKPLVQDMHSGLVTLCSDPFDVRKIVGRGKAVRTFDDRPPPFSKGMAGSVRTGVHLHARVKIRNFNTYLANQLGLLNPADVIFDAIKFSYALNWVSNAQQVLQSWTDFAGLDVLDPVTTRKYSGAARTYWGSYPWVTSAKSIVYWNRSVGGSFAPPFVWKRFGWTPIRAANVISLLSQELYKTANRPGLK